ncbi:hypothetical protein K505DRAFT_257503 [Melanomma pulvis-pyrius CBS 109.77]|uniref:Uncharacterized protein n=1 Tax=Melanomma pulvis-pyrius CBS 109.77 TaxID=1314802 RepID=A0A6A6WTT3_9PLEO|nr:hypothetical protein K505DRAFT_257503 [Melanomma pulvis-pyrius CBS 109.77]
MAVAAKCRHIFGLIKSDTTLILWNCNLCHSGLHWFIYQCFRCKNKICRNCMHKLSRYVISTVQPLFFSKHFAQYI